MKLTSRIKTFAANESGVMQSDVAVLAAAGAFIGLAAFAYVSSGVEQLDSDRGYQLEAQEKVTSF